MPRPGVLVAAPLFAAALLVPSSPYGARSDAAPYRATAAVRLTTGAAGAHPLVGLVAILDDGSGLIGAGGQPPFTGEIVFGLARGHLAPGAVHRLATASTGTQIGYLTASPAGGTQLQNAIRVRGSTTDARTGDVLLSLSVDIVPDFAPVIGATIPLTLRIAERELVFTLNLQRVVRTLAHAGTQLRLNAVSIYLLGKARVGGRARPLTLNQSRLTVLRDRVAARACLDDDCTRLGDTADSDAAITLPQRVVVHAPRRAVYGLSTRFSGSAPIGESVQLAYLRPPGSAPECTLVSVTVCAPRYGPTWDKVIGAPVVRVRSDRTWSLSAQLRSVFSVGVSGLHQATGRYVAVAFSGTGFAGSLNGGVASVFTSASRQTVVRLARPQLKLTRSGDHLRLSVHVRGGDSFVDAVVRMERRVVASGYLDAGGSLVREVAVPTAPTTVLVTVMVRGAQRSSTSVRYRP